MSIESMMTSNHRILCHPFLLPRLIFPSIRVFSNESVLCLRWPKYWSFSFKISPSNEYSGLIVFRIYWFDLLAVQGTQVSSPTPQFKSIYPSALSLIYGTTHTSIHGKTIAFTRFLAKQCLCFLICYLGLIRCLGCKPSLFPK